MGARPGGRAQGDAVRARHLDLADHAVLIRDGVVVDQGDTLTLTTAEGPFQEYVQQWYDQLDRGAQRSVGTLDLS